MMLKEYKQTHPLAFKLNDNHIDKKWLGAYLFLSALLLRLVNPKAFPPDSCQIISVSTHLNH